MRWMRWILAIQFLVVPCVPVALSCQYNVRDVGFTDLGSEPYRLYIYVQQDTPQDEVTTFQQIVSAAFLETNVQFEMVETDQQPNHPAMEYFRFWGITAFPGAVLVSPQGTSLALRVPEGSPRDTAWAMMDSVADSPTEREILKHLVRAYCVVLFVQGDDDAANETAQATVTRVMEQIAKRMPQMPKTIEEPPHLITLDREQLPKERVLLWSLGIQPKELHEPVVAILYGRGRRMGPPLHGDQISGGEFLNSLSLIGASCECGLDKSWILGSMIPVRWGTQRQSEVVKLLGFDAENPIVRLEISQILSLGGTAHQEQKPGEVPSGLFGAYSEQTVEFVAPSTNTTVSPAQLQAMAEPETTTSGIGGTLHRTLLVVGGLVLLVLLGGASIMVRARRKEARS